MDEALMNALNLLVMDTPGKKLPFLRYVKVPI